MDQSWSNPSPAYILSYTIGHGDDEQQHEPWWPRLYYRPSQAECYRLVVKEWYDTKQDRATALRELRQYGYFWLPCKKRIIKDIGWVPGDRALVDELLEVVEIARHHEPCECRDGEDLCLRCAAFHAYQHATGHGE